MQWLSVSAVAHEEYGFVWCALSIKKQDTDLKHQKGVFGIALETGTTEVQNWNTATALRSYTDEERFQAPFTKYAWEDVKMHFKEPRWKLSSNYWIVGGRGNCHQISYRIIHNKMCSGILETCPNRMDAAVDFWLHPNIENQDKWVRTNNLLPTVFCIFFFLSRFGLKLQKIHNK